MATGRQSPQSSLPPLSQKTLNTTTWGTAGNTSSTITDEYCHPNSMVIWHTTGATPPAGRWNLVKNQGSFNFISTDAESATLPITYIIL